MIEKSKDIGLVKHDIGGSATGHDGAEDTGLGHKGDVTGWRMPVAVGLVQPTQYHRSMSDLPVNLSPGLPATVLPPVPDEVAAALEEAATLDHHDKRREVLARAAAAAPRSPDVWAALAEVARDDIERYAYYRIGYHRGLDALRSSGWRGSGYVRWAEPTNRSFLRCLAGLGRSAAAIGEKDEVERISLFLKQLDPSEPEIR